ncbi:MAG: YicC family protein [Firmicutes bacterium HGW-Firmicutes-1]|nr:MAG: YicC family protein [Firmicutes bacterium HGW-Firmicutes-1]
MIKSMTGFGRGEFEKDKRKIIVEMKSVNHRYCEVNVRMPRKLGFLENEVRSYVKQKLSRGKIDVFISYEDNSDKLENIKFNAELAKEYLKYFELISEEFDLENDIKVSHMTRYPDVLVVEEQDDDQEELWSILKGALDNSSDQLIETRSIEGNLLKEDMLKKLDIMFQALNEIKEKAPQIVVAYKEKLESRIKDLLENASVDESRLAQEVAIFADKACIDEEIVRLISHIEHMKNSFATDVPIGRKLDFLTQEMNREANTILSKANAIDISNQALDLKTEIEKIREQIQNIE